MKIYFARHGQYLNPEGIDPHRQPGFPLTKIGAEQAQLIGDNLSKLKIRTLTTSPIQRCVETAVIVGHAIGLHPNQKDELIEVAELEPREEIIARITKYVDALKGMSSNSSHLIISHGDPINFYLSTTLSKLVRAIPMGGLVMLDYSQKGTPKYQEII